MDTQKVNTNTLFGSLLAGFAISLSCRVYLAHPDIIGAVLFACGLVAVVVFRLKLYTGCIYLLPYNRSLGFLLFVLMGNLIGCVLTAVATCGDYETVTRAASIVNSRMGDGFLKCMLTGIGCGWVMTLAVWTYKYKQSYVAILLGVPFFIMSGLTHSIADAYYYALAATMDFNLNMIIPWTGTVLGNLVGGTMFALAVPESERNV